MEADTQLRAVPQVGALENESQRSLPVTEDQERRDEHDEVEVEAPECRASFLDGAHRRALRDTEVNDPRGKPDDEERDRETRLLAVLRRGAAELIENEGEAGKPARGRAECELGGDAQEVRDRQDDHVDRDQCDQIEVGALDGGKRAIGGLHGQMMTYRTAAERRPAHVSANWAGYPPRVAE